MRASKDQRKKALQIVLALFLVAGGLIFMLSVYQGLGDLRSMEKKGNFSYGYVARRAAIPLFQYFSLGEEKEYVRSRGRVDSAGKVHSPAPDISNWTEKAAASATPAAAQSPTVPYSAPSFAAQPKPNAPVPKMAALAGGIGGGGGSSQSSAAAPKSSGVGDKPVTELSRSKVSGEIKVSETGMKTSAPTTSLAGKTMGALASVKTAMIDSLKSHSAMGASSKWGEAFGADAARGGGHQTMGFNSGSGLAMLDSIKGGVGNLKLNNPASLKTVSPPSPTRDKASEDKDAFLKAMQGAGGQGGAAQGEKNAQEATKNTQGQTGADGKAVAEVPPEIIEKAYKPVSEGGTYCGSGQCATSKGQAIDTEVRISPIGDGKYKVDYSGTQAQNDGNHSDYTDSVILDQNNPDVVQPAGSTANCNGGEKQRVEQDKVPPGCPVEPNKPRI